MSALITCPICGKRNGYELPARFAVNATVMNFAMAVSIRDPGLTKKCSVLQPGAIMSI
jgi:hypothetical protein